VLFVNQLSTRRIHIAGIASEPDSAWMNQIARNLTDVGDGFLTGRRFLIHDRDPRFAQCLASWTSHRLRLFANAKTTVH
jgi:putative transposase